MKRPCNWLLFQFSFSLFTSNHFPEIRAVNMDAANFWREGLAIARSSTARAATACLIMLLLVTTSTEAQVKPWACTNVCSSTATRPGTTNCRLDCAVDVCNPQLADIRGEMLVLAIGSHGSTGEAVPDGERPSVCCTECQAAEFCNLWRWCSSPAGCGEPGQCTRYITAARYNSLQPYKQFGPYNSINNACTQDGRWPYGMCSLMLVQSPTDANHTSNGTSSGFVSGLVATKLRANAGCPVGISGSACKMCLATKNPASCFTLVKRSYQFQPEVPIPARIAAVCANMSSPSLVNTCMWCRTHDFDCLMNVLRRHADDPAAAEAAMKCVRSFRNGRTSSMAACSTCPAVKDAKLQAACFNCYNKTLRAGSFWPDGCSRCFGQLSADPAGCSRCVVGASLKYANNSNPDIMIFADEVNAACFQCSQPAADRGAASVSSTAALQQAAASCYKCIGHAPSNKAYCTVASDKKVSTSSELLLPTYFKCLNGSTRQPKTFNGLACKACLQGCGGKGAAAAASCFSCAAKVQGGGGALCGACHCGVGKAKAGNAAKCEVCAAQLLPTKVVGCSNLAGHVCMRTV